MSVVIRKMQPEDLPAVMAILSQWNMAPRSDLENAERSEVVVENTFVAEREIGFGGIVGVASYILHSDDLAETASLAVAPDMKGKGIGYQLQMARLTELKQRGIKTVRTETDRPETIAWYIKKFNYRKVGRNPKKHRFSLPDVDFWTVLELEL